MASNTVDDEILDDNYTYEIETSNEDRLCREQNENLYDEEDCNSEFISLQFTLSLQGPTLSNPPGNKAVDYFNLFFDDQRVNSFVDFTNSNYKCSCDKNKENTLDIIDLELRAYVGVKILIEVLYKDRLEELWSSIPK